MQKVPEAAIVEAGLSAREKVMEYLKQRKVPAQYDTEDLEEDMRNFCKSIGK